MTQPRNPTKGNAARTPTPSGEPGDPPAASGLDRRDFVRVAGLGAAGLVGAASAEGSRPGETDAVPAEAAAALADPEWPSLRHYPQDRLARIALPLGGIGTGTVSLGGRGDLCDWEIMNRPASDGVTYRTSWAKQEWGFPILDFWDDFSADGRLEERERPEKIDEPAASLAVAVPVPPRETRVVTFVLAWHFPNRYTWTPRDTADDLIGNYYTTLHRDAWDVAERTVPRLVELRERTAGFVSALCGSDLPAEVKEATLFNLSTLRTQTCFRTPDGRFFGFEGCASQKGCCHGSCTHVWNYEQATAFLFGALALSMREVEFGFATSDDGLMSFRVGLPLSRGQDFGKAAADGQMGCILKMHRDWQLSGDDALLRRLWPKVRKAVEFCWIEGGWDADRDGVMEGAQHNTMDVEYYGPNPQMGIWYLGALRAAEEMARYLGDRDFAATCRSLFESGREWIDAHLFNGEYYEHEVRAPRDPSEIAPGLLVGGGSDDVTRPDFQLASGCLVDQLVGQFLAHVCGLGHLVDPDRVRRSLASILRYNLRKDLSGHFNSMRSYALGSESALLMASYPEDRPRNPFPYFTEAMTGYEYTAAVGMLYEGMLDEGLESIRRVRARYEGRRRNPFDEAECGHHYARAMASWAAMLAWTGFRYSAVTRTLTLAPRVGRFFWSSGYGWGDYSLGGGSDARELSLRLGEGRLDVSRVVLTGFGRADLAPARVLAGHDTLAVMVGRDTDGA